MSLEISERDREGITILNLKGRMVIGPETEHFRTATRELIDTGKHKLVLNMGNVDHIDSSGLGELVALANVAQSAGGQVKLVNLNQRHVELLIITKLSTVFDSFNDEQEAVNSFFPDRQLPTFDLLAFVKEINQEQP